MAAAQRPVAGRLLYVGHATVLIELDGVRLLTDPVLRSRIWHLKRRVSLDMDELGGSTPRSSHTSTSTTSTGRRCGASAPT